MQSETGFPSSHQLKSYVASKSRLKLAARAVLSADAGLHVFLFIAAFGLMQLEFRPYLWHQKSPGYNGVLCVMMFYTCFDRIVTDEQRDARLIQNHSIRRYSIASRGI